MAQEIADVVVRLLPQANTATGRRNRKTPTAVPPARRKVRVLMSDPMRDVAAFFNASIRTAGEDEQVPPGFISALGDMGDGTLVRLFIPYHLIPPIPLEGQISVVRKEGGGDGDVADADAGS